MLKNTLSLYIHFPWCIQKCPYCDFNSHSLKSNLPELAYIQALIEDLSADLAEFNLKKPAIHSIFMGGGTPSLFSPNALEILFDALHNLLDLSKTLEITLEANPGTVDSQYFLGYHSLGINRISLGVQSFNTLQLKKLGRIHSSAEAIQAFDIARNAGFDNINIDLMFALPKQSIAALQADITQVIALAPEHISYYQLTLEPNTLFAKHPPPLPNDETSWKMQTLIIDTLSQHQYQQYEISNFNRQRPCQHNLAYWQYADYLGIGAGAHGKISHAGQIDRTIKHKHPKTYLQQTNKQQAVKTVNPADQLFEFMLNTLRLKMPTSFERLWQTTHLKFTDIETQLHQACKLGLLTYDTQQFQPTAKGYLYLNELQELFLP